MAFDRALVTIAGAGAWCIAVGIAVRWRATRRPTPSPTDGAPAGERLGRAVARAAGGMAGAALAGILVLGLGSRLMMRVLAATSPPAAQGRITDAEEVVGEVTLGGTVGLLVFVGLFGAIAGLAGYRLLRRWLPDRSLLAGLALAGIGAGLLARPSGLLDPDNPDFTILEPAWLAVVLAVGLVATFGLTAAVLMDRWSASWPPPGRSVRGVLGVLPLVPLLAVPPAAAIAALAVLNGAFVAPRTVASGAAWRFDPALRGLVLLAAGLGGAWTLASAAAIVV